jgi:6,7-dimethyl-8-ribityllumazine synthase
MNIIEAKKEDRKPKNIAIVTSLFNERITKKMEKSALQFLAEHDMKPYAQVYVPGAVEIPLAVKNLLEKKDCDAVIALGLVVRGETAHFDYVCLAVERGCSQLQLEYNKPVAFGVLTTENGAQAEARSDGTKGDKGYEAAEVAHDMLQILESIKKL